MDPAPWKTSSRMGFNQLRTQRAETYYPEDEVQKVQMMCAYVPGIVIQEYLSNNKPQLPLSKSINGGVLFADISGFSRLAESLVSKVKDTANAAETLSNYVGKSLDRMVNTIYSRGGDVIKFAGDAIMALFPADRFDDSLEQAILCCTQVARELVTLDLYVGGEETGGAVTLKVHCGVGGGKVSVFHVGGLNGRWECVLNGSPVDQISSAEPEALAGQVVISAESFRVIGTHCQGKRLKSGNFRVDSIVQPTTIKEYVAPFANVLEYIDMHPSKIETIRTQLRQYIPFPARMLVDSNQTLWNAELRYCATMFVRVRGLDFKSETQLPAVQNVVEMVQKCVYTFEGTFCRFIVDDKGSSFLIAFGLPPIMHENDGRRATQAALQLHNAIRNISRKQNSPRSKDCPSSSGPDPHASKRLSCSIGVTTGRVFCGSVGGSTRCEYTMHGTSVNMAARYMVAANGTVLCGEETYREADTVIEFAAARHIRVKGKKEAVRVYQPLRLKKVEFRQAYLHNIGRRKEKQYILSILANYMGQPSAHRVVVIDGEAGVGKTHFANHVVHEASQYKIFPMYCTGNDMEKKTPFYIFRSIFEQLLEVHDAGYRRTSVLTWAQKQGLVESGLVTPMVDIKPLTAKRKRAILQALLPGTVISDELISVLALVIPNMSKLLLHGGGKTRGGGSFIGVEDQSTWEENFRTVEESPSVAKIKRSEKKGEKSKKKQRKKSSRDEEQVPSATETSTTVEPTLIQRGDRDPESPVSSKHKNTSAAGSDSPSLLLTSATTTKDLKLQLSSPQGVFAGPVSPSGTVNKKLMFRGGSFSETPASPQGSNMRQSFMTNTGTLDRQFRRTNSQAGGHHRTASTGSTPGGGEPMSSGVIEDLLLRMVQKVSQNILQRSQSNDSRSSYKRLCIVVDAFQWVDERSMEVIGQLIARVDKLLVVLVTRNQNGTLVDSRITDSGLHQKATKMVQSLRRRSWAHFIELRNFSKKELSEAIMSWTSSSQVGDKVVEMVYGKTKGHPWFSEELVKLLQQRKLIELETSRGQNTICKLSRDAFNSGYGLPDTIAALLTSRLDRLPQSQLIVLKVASVLGTAFTKALVAQLVPFADGSVERRNQDIAKLRRRVDSDIAALVRQDILVTNEGDILATETFTFKSTLLREAAYGLLLFQTRRDLHGQVAQFIESRQRDYLAPYVSTLAEHYYLAQNYEKAVMYLEIAGDTSLMMRSMSTAQSCFQKLLSLDAKFTEHKPITARASWHRKLGEALLYFRSNAEAEEHLNAALDILQLNCASSSKLRGKLLPHKIRTVMDLPRYRAIDHGRRRQVTAPVLDPPGPIPRVLERSVTRSTRPEEPSGNAPSDEQLAEDKAILLQAAQAYELLGEIEVDRSSPRALERRLNAMHLAYRASELEEGTYDLPAELGRSCANLAVFFCANPAMVRKATQYAQLADSSIKRISDGETQAFVNMRVGEYLLLTGQFPLADNVLLKAVWSSNFLGLDRMAFNSRLLRMAMLTFMGKFRACEQLATSLDEEQSDHVLVVVARSQLMLGKVPEAVSALARSAAVPAQHVGDLLFKYGESGAGSEELGAGEGGLLSGLEGCTSAVMVAVRYMDTIGLDSVEFGGLRTGNQREVRGGVANMRDRSPLELRIVVAGANLLGTVAEHMTHRGYTDLPIGLFHTLTHLFTAMNSVWEWCLDNGFGRGLQIVKKKSAKYLKPVQKILATFAKSYSICRQHASYCKGLLRKFIGNSSSAKSKFVKCIPVSLRVMHGGTKLPLTSQKSKKRDKLAAMFKRGKSSLSQPNLGSNTDKLSPLEKTYSPYVTAAAMWEFQNMTSVNSTNAGQANYPLELIYRMFESCGAKYECERVQKRIKSAGAKEERKKLEPTAGHEFYFDNDDNDSSNEDSLSRDSETDSSMFEHFPVGEIEFNTTESPDVPFTPDGDSALLDVSDSEDSANTSRLGSTRGVTLHRSPGFSKIPADLQGLHGISL